MKMIALAAGVLLVTNPAFANTYTVRSLADTGPNTLRAAIASAASGDTITFAPWMYEKTIWLNSELTINKTLTIKGDLNGDHKPDVILDGQRKTRLFNVPAGGNLTVVSLELMRGHANEGAAIINRGTVKIQYSRLIRNESVGLGAAIYNKGTLTLETTTAMYNKAWSHGGVIYNNGTLRVKTSTFAHNLADKTGGVIYNDYTTSLITNSTFSYNAVKRSGYWQNTDNKGSVLYNMMGTVEFRDSTLVDNISSPITTPEEPKRCASNCNNSASETLAEVKDRNRQKRMLNGGTIYNYGGANAKEIILRRTVITGSQGRNCGGLGGFAAGASSWSDDWTCVQQLHYDDHGTDRGNPKLGPLADNGGYTLTHMPLSGSGLINASPTSCPTHDQRGATRDSRCDIGAVEANRAVPARQIPRPINTTPPEEHNEDIAALNSRITSLHLQLSNKRAEIAAKTAQINTLNARIEQLQSQLTDAYLATADVRVQLATALRQRDAAQVALVALRAQHDTEIAALTHQLYALQQRLSDAAQAATTAHDQEEAQAAQDRISALVEQYLGHMAVSLTHAGKQTRIEIDGDSVLYEHQVVYKAGQAVDALIETKSEDVHDHIDGSKISRGQFEGDNGVVHWRTVTTMQAGSDFHVTRYEFSSDKPFGEVSVSSYTDVDFGQSAWENALIVGGDHHARRLLIVDGTQPTVGVSVGVRDLKNAQYLGWLGSQIAYYAYGGNVLSPGRLTGPKSDWGKFTPDQQTYPGAQGYGPGDMAVSLGIKLNPAAKTASFELTTVGAPDGIINY